MTAAHEWDEPAALGTVRTSLPGSYERVFHDVGMPAFVVRLSSPALSSALEGPRLERAIDVIYRPEDGAGEPLRCGATARSSSISSHTWIAHALWSLSNDGVATRSTCRRPTARRVRPKPPSQHCRLPGTVDGADPSIIRAKPAIERPENTWVCVRDGQRQTIDPVGVSGRSVPRSRQSPR